MPFPALTFQATAFQAPDLTEACGLEPAVLCRVVFEQTNRTWLAWLAGRPLTILLIATLAWLLVRLIRRQIPRTASAYTAAREAEEARSARKDLSEDQRLSRALQLERSRQRAGTLSGVVASIMSGLIWFLAVLLVLDQVGVSLAPLLAGAGVVGIAIGFGAQQMVKDYLAGIFIIMEDQYGVGDVVDLGEASGTVEQVNLRVTRLRDVNGIVWYVPNGEIRRVGNTSKLWSTALLDIDVSYDTDLDRAGAILQRVANDLRAEENDKLTIIADPEFVGVQSFGADGVTLRLMARTEPSEQWAVARELRRRIKVAFDSEGIDIPFPQRTVWLRSIGPDTTIGESSSNAGNTDTNPVSE